MTLPTRPAALLSAEMEAASVAMIRKVNTALNDAMEKGLQAALKAAGAPTDYERLEDVAAIACTIHHRVAGALYTVTVTPHARHLTPQRFTVRMDFVSPHLHRGAAATGWTFHISTPTPLPEAV